MTATQIDLTDPMLSKAPGRAFRELADKSRLTRASFPGVGELLLVTGYDDVRFVLGDPRFVKDASNVPGLEVTSLRQKRLDHFGVPEEYQEYLLNVITNFDGADHARLRKLVTRAFTVRRLAELRPRVERLAEDLLDRLPDHAEDGVVDLLAHFAYPLPINVICEMVGVPESDREFWRQASDALLQPNLGEKPGMMPFVDAVCGLVDASHELINLRRAAPEDDLISVLVHAQEADGDRLSDKEMVALVFALIFAGHETTAHLISSGTAALLSHPDQLALVKSDPDRIPRAVHEMLRWCAVVTIASVVYAKEDVPLGDEVIRKGEAVMPALTGANFDPARFPEAERFDITRESSGPMETHVGFSHGPHYCLGAALARMEGDIAFRALLRKYPNVELGVPVADLPLDAGFGTYRYAALPVRL
ncbi:hypothetical protein EV191_101983 [Tamaricihabitans halophyticus]|uniref:Cytochrome P450 n=1 Tax=Tamaricihabitans halophyticus TaxID=1262583 RepID=A0A4R2RBE4_9PSEU|nr:cytochrome P450 [Tamaricihabitans halophyticus]TCP57031.1 hypothetical protein EV191_101983 [Tamaricihabitans halophyticus]